MILFIPRSVLLATLLYGAVQRKAPSLKLDPAGGDSSLIVVLSLSGSDEARVNRNCCPSLTVSVSSRIFRLGGWLNLATWTAIGLVSLLLPSVAVAYMV